MTFPWLLYAYIASETLAPFLATFVILNSVLLLGQVIPLLDVVLNLGIGVLDLIRLVAYLAPKMMLFSLPLASMLGVVLGISRLSGEGNILSLKASGVSLFALMPPIIVIGLVNSLLTGYCAMSLMPAGEIGMKNLLFQLAREKFDRGIREHYFSEGTGNFIFHIDKIDPRTKAWQGVYISDVRDAAAPMTIIARRGNFSSESNSMTVHLDLSEGSIHRTEGELTQTVTFSRYQLSLPITAPMQVAGKRATDIDKNTMTMAQLSDQAEKIGHDTEQGITYLIEFHQRMVIPVGCLLLTVLGLPLGLIARPGQKAFGIPVGMGLFLLFYIGISLAKTIIEGRALPVWVSLWAVNVFYGAFTVFLVRLSGNESLDAHVEKISRIFHTIKLQLLRRKS